MAGTKSPKKEKAQYIPVTECISLASGSIDVDWLLDSKWIMVDAHSGDEVSDSDTYVFMTVNEQANGGSFSRITMNVHKRDGDIYANIVRSRLDDMWMSNLNGQGVVGFDVIDGIDILMIIESAIAVGDGSVRMNEDNSVSKINGFTIDLFKNDSDEEGND